MGETTNMISPFPMEIGRVIKRENKDVYIITLNDYKGKIFIDIRLHYFVNGGQDTLPTKKGITLNLDTCEPVVKLIQDAYKALDEVMKNPDINKELKAPSND